jgi:hypothetical protein
MDICNNYDITSVGDQFTVKSSSVDVRFQATNNVIAQLFTPVSEVSLTSLEPIPTRPFTKNEMIGAKLVQDFISRTAFESYASVYQAAKHGSISNIPFSTRDVTNSIKIYGELIPSLKGKSVAHSINVSDAILINKLEQ